MFRKMLLAAAGTVGCLLVAQINIRPSEAMPIDAAPSASLKEKAIPLELAGNRGYAP